MPDTKRALPQFHLRLPPDILAWMRAQAAATNRSTSNWLVWTLQELRRKAEREGEEPR